MRYLLLFLILPVLSAQAEAPTCERLKEIAGVLEKRLNQQRFPSESCDKKKPEDFGLPVTAIGFPATSKAGEWDYRCKDLSAIDQQLKSLENEMALLNGITGLKQDVTNGIATLQKFTNHNLAKDASGRLVKNLAIAEGLELFLATNNEKSENILSHLVKADVKEWENLESFGKLISNYCKNYKGSGATVCASGFKLTEDVFQEIREIVKIGKNTQPKFNKKHIEDLTDALSIKKGEDKYSFGQLAQEVGQLGEDGMLSKEAMEKLKVLPELHNGSRYDFLKEMKASLKDLKDSEQLVGAQEIPQRFEQLMADLKNRQQWEMKSKLSLVLHSHLPTMPEDLKSKCLAAQELTVKVEECLDPLMKTQGMAQLDKSIIGDYLLEMKYGEAHLAKIDEVIASCKPNDKLEYDQKKCEGVITKKMADLVNKAQTLNSIKAKLLQDNAELWTLRNFALEQLESEECMASASSNIADCSVDLGTISKEVITLSGAAGDILHLFAKPENETDISSICEGEGKTPHKSELCALMAENVKEQADKNKPNPPPAPRSHLFPDQPNTTGRDLLNIGTALAQTLGNYFAPKPQMGPMMNPYPVYPYAPAGGPPALSISQKIMGPHLAMGYGTYVPTPGLRPYSSVNSNVTTYAGYTFGSSARFNSPVGW